MDRTSKSESFFDGIVDANEDIDPSESPNPPLAANPNLDMIRPLDGYILPVTTLPWGVFDLDSNKVEPIHTGSVDSQSIMSRYPFSYPYTYDFHHCVRRFGAMAYAASQGTQPSPVISEASYRASQRHLESPSSNTAATLSSIADSPAYSVRSSLPSVGTSTIHLPRYSMQSPSWPIAAFDGAPWLYPPHILPTHPPAANDNVPIEDVVSSTAGSSTAVSNEEQRTVEPYLQASPAPRTPSSSRHTNRRGRINRSGVPDPAADFLLRIDYPTNRQARFACLWQDCDKTFERQDRALGHVRTHQGQKPYGCNGSCEDRFWYVPL
ncbi:hypothetical protein FRC16_000349 [Serendipita sp. 398]|nr:hypothetical protein FRC16_000349 [Serendipita sp. 398]